MSSCQRTCKWGGPRYTPHQHSYPPSTPIPTPDIKVLKQLFGTSLGFQYCDIRDFIVSYIHSELVRYWDIMIGGKYTVNIF